jgi:release factor glutamine methyltransferase
MAQPHAQSKEAGTEAPWTILKVLQWTTGYFQRHEIEQARANAEVLLAHVLGLERIQLYLRHDQPLTGDELAKFREVVRRRAAREPTQYIMQKQEFWSLDFEVTPSVLIPRPETELLVQLAAEILGTASARVLDLGTGSGAIAVALAHECPNLAIVAIDSSPAALEVARRNAVRHRVSHRIAMAAMDLFSGLTPSPHFDLMVSNPPYIGDTEFSGIAPEVSRYEPETALKGGGSEGLRVIRRILHDMPLHLKAGGYLLLEIGQGQASLLAEELERNPQIEDHAFIEDYSGVLRVLKLRKSHR